MWLIASSILILLSSGSLLWAQESPVAEALSSPAVADSSAAAVSDSLVASAPAVSESSSNAGTSSGSVAKRQTMSMTVINSNILSGVLSAQGSPYLIDGVVQVPAGDSLLIEAGVEIYFSPQRRSGMQVYGKFLVAGTAEQPVRFQSHAANPHPGDWDRIQISGDQTAVLNHVEISHGQVNLHIENSALNLSNAKIFASALRGIYVRNAQVEISQTEFAHHGELALHLANSSYVRAQQLNVNHSNTAIAAMDHSFLHLAASSLQNNETALYLLPLSHYQFSNNQIENNKVAVMTTNAFDKEYRQGIKNNGQNLQKVLEPVAQKRFADINLYGDILRFGAAEDLSKIEPEKETWSFYGNVGYGGGYSHVITKRNRSGSVQNSWHGDVQPGEKYPNIFTPQGLVGEGYAYMFLESNQGRSVEFQGEFTADSWNYFRAQPVFMRYKSTWQTIVLGDLNANVSPIFVSGMSALGADYKIDIKLGERSLPFFGVEVLVGESQRPLGEGERHPDIFGQYTEEGQALPQELAAMGSFYVRPFNSTKLQMGALLTESNREKLLVRNDIGPVATAEPVLAAANFFAGLSWRTPRDDFGLFADVAVGRADTAHALAQKAMDQVMLREGLRPVPLATNQWLLEGSARIRSASSDQIYQIFSRNVPLTVARDSLINLMQEVNRKKSQMIAAAKDEQVASMEWSKENLAARAGADWRTSWVDLQVYGQYSGYNYMSPGAKSLLRNSREYGGSAWIMPLDAWQIGVDYQLLVENASSPTGFSLFGIHEGTFLGLNQDDNWEREHLLDQDRARLSHDFKLANHINIFANLDLSLSYGLYQTAQNQARSLNVTENYATLVFFDPWFAPRTDRKTTAVEIGGTKYDLDAERVSEFESVVATHGFDLAQGLREDYHIHSVAGELQWRRSNYVWRMGAGARFSLDKTDFERRVLYEYSWQDSTFAKLGWIPQSNEWKEFSYPLSMVTTVGGITNQLGFVPRWRNFTRTGDQEWEWQLSNNFEFKLNSRYTVLADVYWQNAEQEYRELGAYDYQNLDLSMGLRINWRWDFYTQLTLQGSRAWYSDSPQDEYSSGLAKLTFHHIF